MARAVAKAKLDAVADGVIVCARRCDCLSVGGVIGAADTESVLLWPVAFTGCLKSELLGSAVT